MTNQVAHETEAERIGRLYAALSRINQAIVRLPTRDELFVRVCQILVEDGGFSMAWIGWNNPATLTIEPLARWGDDHGYVDAITVHSDDSPEGCGPSGTAFRTGQASVSNDMRLDAALLPWRKNIEQNGYHSVAAFAVRKAEKIRGTLNVYSDEVGFFQDKEIALLKEAAVDISFALDNLARQEARLRAEAALRESEQRFRATFEQAAVGIAHVAMDGSFLRINDRLCQITGFPRDELMRRRYVDLAIAEDPDATNRIRDEIRASLQGGAPLEHRFLHNDGSICTASIASDVVRDPNGVPKYVVVVVSDTTERKNLEIQFLRAQRMESIGTLAGGIAHDLNNAFAPILMALELLKAECPEPATRELIDIAATSARRGADMVKQVLLFARGEDGRRVAVQVKDLLRDVEKILRDTFLRNIELRSNIAPELWAVVGDPTQLHQVLMNLCLNARDAMPTGGALTITAKNLRVDAQFAALNPEAHPGPYVVLEVADSGIGMPAGLIEKIFDPFFTTKEVGEGTGLGLSTSLGIVKSHGGFMRAHSVPGKGSTFRVYFPAQSSSVVEPVTAAVGTMPRGNDELILVVDDEPAVRQITRRTLEAFGYRVLLATNGAEAEAIFAQRMDEIAAVLTDMTMPVMDGPATIRALRRLQPEVRIIATSGLSATGHVGHASLLGVTHFLPKPSTAETLLTVLRETLTAR